MIGSGSSSAFAYTEIRHGDTRWCWIIFISWFCSTTLFPHTIAMCHSACIVLMHHLATASADDRSSSLVASHLLAYLPMPALAGLFWKWWRLAFSRNQTLRMSQNQPTLWRNWYNIFKIWDFSHLSLRFLNDVTGNNTGMGFDLQQLFDRYKEYLEVHKILEYLFA